MNTKTTCLLVGLLALSLIYSCASIPKNAKAVQPFLPDAYLGKWYEIARFDYIFERNLDNVTANYSKGKNGEIKVLNKGFNYKKQKWSSSEGIAKFTGAENTAALKVSFFRPIYAAYNVIAIDKDYKYAMVAGKNLNYLWLLSRQKTMPMALQRAYLKQAEEIGYDTGKLIYVKHDK
ncbi:hypothetical protein OC25_02415 [Pedobacter kyungheensis]|uniref:Lipocalin/cytosolic fatty-acid binding domain-containing protein n=1 Tax=Pedobacter kyungheensis TaxID=1069985 RepID=A0A0C1G937_9SPHI|nr:lipocalin family protein [Pedobacter kyungheensis]KIA96604.1 hypothetical protein OC25_02415 [Pedobacter kyungheensis]